MNFTPTPLAGVYVVDTDPVSDARGWFARTWCAAEFTAHGLSTTLAQCSLSHNLKRGTLRGMHFQSAQHAEAKLVRCIRGTIYDVAVDVRPASVSYKHWFGVELSADNHRALHIPEGCAHGFITLADDCDLYYQMNHPHEPACARSFRWDDPEIHIVWPMKPLLMSNADRDAPAFRDCLAQIKT